MEKQEILVFKIGGAGLENSERIRVFADDINSLLSHSNCRKIIVVCSAIKGVTRLLDSIFQDWKVGNYISMEGKLQDFYFIHNTIILELFTRDRLIHKKFESLYNELKKDLYKKRRINKSEMRANILQYGEIVSSEILSHHFSTLKLDNELKDIRDYIKTKTSGNKTQIHKESEKLLLTPFTWLNNTKNLLITQGFIARDYASGKNTVLPFNGSDISAAYVAHSVNATKIFFLKDIVGVSSDSNVKPGDTTNFYQWMSYNDYIDRFKGKRSYPVHPQAIQILRRRKIPVRICCFMYPNSYGTEIRG